MTDEQVAELRRLRNEGLALKEAHKLAMPQASESYCASIWYGGRRNFNKGII